MMEVARSRFRMVPKVEPRAIRIAPLQNTSPASAGKKRIPATAFPKRRSNGSRSVVKPWRRMILAKKSPPRISEIE